jgi:GTP:adenosylcobinamide-phosphate guanylyltransferase
VSGPAPDGLFDVIVLAASRGPDDPMARAFDAPHKCLIEVAGTPMLARVIAALVASPSAARIVISVEDPSVIDRALGGADSAAFRERVSFVASCDRASASVAAAAEHLGFQRPVLVTTADHALLSPEMVTYFCKAAMEDGADVAVGLESADILLGAYPDARRTFIRFSDGRYSGCNLFALVNPDAMRAVEFWRHVERERKKPWRLARAFGWRLLLAYLFGVFSLDRAMMEVSRVIGVRATAVRMPFADAAIDVDKPEDLEAVERILAGRPV